MKSYQAYRKNPIEKAISIFAAGRSEKESITDLLTDLRHYCDANGLSFMDLNRQSLTHWQAEAIK